jgi:hypothetical protein
MNSVIWTFFSSTSLSWWICANPFTSKPLMLHSTWTVWPKCLLWWMRGSGVQLPHGIREMNQPCFEHTLSSWLLLEVHFCFEVGMAVKFWSTNMGVSKKWSNCGKHYRHAFAYIHLHVLIDKVTLQGTYKLTNLHYSVALWLNSLVNLWLSSLVALWLSYLVALWLSKPWMSDVHSPSSKHCLLVLIVPAAHDHGQWCWAVSTTHWHGCPFYTHDLTWLCHSQYTHFMFNNCACNCWRRSQCFWWKHQAAWSQILKDAERQQLCNYQSCSLVCTQGETPQHQINLPTTHQSHCKHLLICSI